MTHNDDELRCRKLAGELPEGASIHWRCEGMLIVFTNNTTDASMERQREAQQDGVDRQRALLGNHRSTKPLMEPPTHLVPQYG